MELAPYPYEQIVLGDKKFEILETPLNEYWPDEKSKPKTIAKNIGRGYQGTWQIFEEKLYLIDIKNIYHNSTLNEISGKKIVNTGLLKLNDVFPHSYGEVFAYWYSGSLTIPFGDRMQNDKSKTERELVISCSDGKVINKYIKENVSNIDVKHVTSYFIKNENLYKPKACKTIGELYQHEFEFGYYDKAKFYFEHIIDLYQKRKVQKKNDLKQLKNEYFKIIKKIVGPNQKRYEQYKFEKERILKKINSNEELSQEEQNIRKLMVYHMPFKFNWGKYKNRVISSILEEDPEYLLWCVIHVSHFSLNELIFLHPKIRSNRLFMPSLKENFVKLDMVKEWSFNYGIGENDFYRRPPKEDYLQSASYVHQYDELDLAMADWDYDGRNNPAHNTSENPWIDLFGPGDEAEVAFWNTD
ncbi:hypothetical protein J4E06_01770 [Muricauda sp. NFXS6]|uniref:exodeoxyribonuclease X C-terminal domain-containing protein n=1 Tax=Allomuricauda sp. NFXS6 TaxID=2819094 RepID=UPI0032DF8D32